MPATCSRERQFNISGGVKEAQGSGMEGACMSVKSEALIWKTDNVIYLYTKAQ
jgi:hypothetical protein